MAERIDRNLALEIVRTTETAALAAAQWMGRCAQIACDHAAVNGMRNMLSSVLMRGVVVIVDGQNTEAPMRYNSEPAGR